MSWKPCLSLPAAALALLLCSGCAGGRGGAVPAESVDQRLANQARAVALLSEENEKLRETIVRLEAEIAAMRAAAGTLRPAGGPEQAAPEETGAGEK